MPFSVMNLNTLFFVEHFCRIMDFGKGPICYIFHDQTCLFFPCSLCINVVSSWASLPIGIFK